MNRPWMPPVRWILGAATLLGLSSTLQAYRLTTLNLKPPDVAFSDLLVLNLAYWYIPALLTRPIFRLSHRLRESRRPWLQTIAIHAAAAIGYSMLHTVGMLSVRSLLWPNYGIAGGLTFSTFAQRLYFMNLDWTLMTYSTIVGLSYALAYYHEAQRRAVTTAQLEARLMETRLRTLEAELHPHFLFNTLHAISTLLHSRPESADRMISRLSDLLRLTFDRSGAPRVPLQEEVEFLQKYLDIEQIRFQDRLTVEYDIDPEALDAEVPRLILQPLAENAIKHGVSPRPGQALIRVAAQRRGDRLVLEVSDNGASAGEAARFSGGVGLSNTRDRLACLYGTDHRLELSGARSGFAVHLDIPFRQAEHPAGATTIRVA